MVICFSLTVPADVFLTVKTLSGGQIFWVVFTGELWSHHKTSNYLEQILGLKDLISYIYV